jgi:biopolymer transport protein ExbD
MRLPQRRGRILTDSNLVSMGDIAFQLIVFFMVAATFARSMSMNVELPSGDDDAVQDDGKSITVQAGASAIAINEQPVELPQLEERLAVMLKDRAEGVDRVVVLVTSDDIPFQRHAAIMHTIRRAGGVVAVMYEEEQ